MAESRTWQWVGRPSSGCRLKALQQRMLLTCLLLHWNPGVAVLLAEASQLLAPLGKGEAPPLAAAAWLLAGTRRRARVLGSG